MDVQMPEMSGIEATNGIRSSEQVSGKHVPVIALTAGAVKGEMENCLAAGMDDFLTKPIDRDMLMKLMQKHLVPAQYQETNPQKKEPSTDPLPHFEEAKLMESLGYSEENLAELLQFVPGQFQSDIAVLHEMIGQQNLSGIRQAAHSIKGAALNMHFSNLSEIAKRIELLSIENDLEEILPLFEAMNEEWKTLRTIIEKLSDK
jgi:DNA-binding response OmpR family regulator